MWKKVFGQFYKHEQDSDRRFVLFILGASLAASCIFFFFDISREFFSLLSLILAASFILAWLGMLRFAGWLAPLAALAIFALLIYNNLGIRDTAILGLPVTIVAASLLNGRKGALVLGLASVGVVTLVWIAEISGLLGNRFTFANTAADYTVVYIVILVTTILLWAIIGRLDEKNRHLSVELAERQRAEAALRESEERYRLISSMTSDYTFSTRVDPDDSMYLDWVAGAFESMTGYTYAEYVAAGGWPAHLHPQDLEKDRQALVKLQQNEPVIHEIRTITKQRALQWVRVYAHPVWDEGLNRLVRIVGAVEDITERQQAQTALQQSAQRLTVLNEIGRAVAELTDLDNVLEMIRRQVEHIIPTDCFVVALYKPETHRISYPLIAEQGVHLFEPDETLSSSTFSGKVIQTGKSIMRLYTREELVDEPLETFTTEGNENLLPASLLFVPMAVKGKIIGIISAQSFEVNAYNEEHLRLLEGVAYQAAIAIENARLFANTQQELDERKKLVRELEDKNAELERFTYTVSHDLKSPLITISGFLGFIEKDAVSGQEERLKADLRRISEATQKMQRLLNELLELSRIGRQMNASQVVPFADLVQDAVENVHGQLETRGVSLVVQPDLSTVYGDRPRLTEVLQNLIDNAVKFMEDHPNPRIEIGQSSGDEKHSTFYVRDNGIGIAPEFHEHIFGLFNKLNPKSEGTGIGLAIVKRIIEVHGGRIWLESAPGQGTTFFFTLPTP